MLRRAGVLRQGASDMSCTQASCRCTTLHMLFVLLRLSSIIRTF